MNIKDENIIKTSDLYFAAYLHAKGCKISRINIEGGKGKGKETNVFCFEDESGEGKLTNSYFNCDEDSAIPALTYANSIKAIKTMCYVR